MLQEPMALPTGAIVQGQNGERYIVEGLLGKGGFSSIYLVRDRHNRDQVYALKELINPDPHERNHLAFEAELLMRLKHRALPHIYKVFENVKLQRVYMVMDYIAGKDLEALREDQPEKRFSVPLAMALLTSIVEATGYLHNQKPPIVHRDIKPANIIVPVGARDTVLVDFGIAKEHIVEKTTSIFRYGTPGYAAPEQYGQGTNPRTDIYALAATFYTLVTGTIPTDALTRGVEMESGDPLKPAYELCPAVPASVSQVLARAMKLRSEDRYASVDEFWRELSFATTLPRRVPSSPKTPLPFTITQQDVRKPVFVGEQRVPRSTATRKMTFRLWLLILLVLVIIGVGIDGVLLYRSQTPSHQNTASQPHVIAKSHTQTVSIANCPLTAFTPATPVAPLYIQTSPGYIGSIGDITIGNGQSQVMCLGNVQQNHDKLTGVFSGLGIVDPFTGTITNTPSTRVHFTVQVGQDRTLSFDGDVRLGGDMAGTFQMLDQNGQTMEAGVWNVHVAQLVSATPTS